MVSCLGSLVQSRSGEGGALQTNVTGLCGERSQCSGHTGFAPLMVCAFPVYTAQAPGCSPGSGPWVACTSQAYAAQIQVFRYSTKTQTLLGLRFVPFLPSSSGSQEHSPRVQHAISPLRSQPQFLGAPCVCSGELDSSCDPSGRCRPSRISGSLWLEPGSLFAVW